MRYSIMFTRKSPTEGRKVSVMDFVLGRIITFEVSEIYGDEMEQDLKDYINTQTKKINTGYWDYTGKHKM
ncbi:hypothetical protein ACFQ4X_05515 [Fictibacillus halophilus]|uniref:hypothetical protein n=1 Tax=Fictibacillus halophilus TaxID=1610490 RepID=UPI00362E0F31